MQRVRFFAFLVFAVLALPAAADTLDRVRQAGEFKLGYRTDAPPFAYETPDGKATGYSVELCRRVAARVRDRLKLSEMKITYVPVSAENRFEMIQTGQIDILCGPTSVTLSRRRIVDFSILTFIDGASVLYRSDGPASFDGLEGKRVGVRRGTTTETSLDATLKAMGLNVEIVDVSDHADALNMLISGDLSAYFADQAILLYLASGHASSGNLRLSKRHFSVEPYALAMQLGDSDFQLIVDETLARLYRSGDIVNVFRASFGENAAPNDLLKSLYTLQSLQN